MIYMHEFSFCRWQFIHDRYDEPNILDSLLPYERIKGIDNSCVCEYTCVERIKAGQHDACERS